MTQGFGKKPLAAALTLTLAIGISACGGGDDQDALTAAPLGEATPPVATPSQSAPSVEQLEPPVLTAAPLTEDASAAPAAELSPAPAGVNPAPAVEAAPANARTASADTTDKTVLDGVFTRDQANRGETTFQQICAACHSQQEFRGSGFQRTWDGRTLADLYELISTMMPLDSPGSLSTEEYTEIVSFFLEMNGYPTGETELPSVRDALQEITIVPAEE